MTTRRTIVYVEDDAANLALVRKVLEREGGFDVIGAATGEAGVELVTSLLPALVLIDLDLPGIDGFAVAAQLKASPQTAAIPLVAISAKVMKQEQQQALAAGCRFFVEKPFDIRELRATIEAALR